MPMRNDKGRAAHFKAITLALRREVRALQAEVKAARCAGYINGSAVTMAGIHRALGNDELTGWLDQKFMGCRVRRPPFNLSAQTEAVVRAEVRDLLERCGYSRVVIDKRMKELEL